MLRTLARRLAAAFALVAAALLLAASPAGAAPSWRTKVEDDLLPVRYAIEAELATIPGEDFPRLVKGRETIVWANLSHDRVDTLYFHLYANAFRDARSAFLRERVRDGGEIPEEMVWGGTEVQQVVLVPPAGRPPATEFVPEPGAPDDRTVLRVRLPRPVEPNERVVLRVDFTTALPKPVARMGAVRDFVFAAQWFPKLGRHLGSESAVAGLLDGWSCPHYHASGEFTADYADYDVTLTVPDGWTLGATGAPEGADVVDAAAGTRRRRYAARSVVDFAWTAGRQMTETARRIDPDDPSATDTVAEEVRVVRSLLGLAPEDAELPPVEVVLLLQPDHADQAERHFEAARVALALYGTWLGPYPYPRLTIVDPAYGAGAVGGMEYPTLVTAGTEAGTPVEARRPEHLVVHEIGHQWFMNLLANDEFREGWLDEALNSWFTARAMHRAWGPASQLTTVCGFHFRTEPWYVFPGLAAGWPEWAGLPEWMRPPALEGLRLWRDGPMLVGARGRRYRDDQDPVLPSRRSWNRVGAWDEMVRPGSDYASAASYRGNAYPRGVLLLESVARHVRARFDRPGNEDGERRVLQAFREYARLFRFRHPGTADLLRVLRKETDLAELPQLFDALARSTGSLDYAVESVRVVEGRIVAGAEPEKPVTEIVVRRRGEVVVPVTVKVDVHGAAAPVRIDWDGAARWTRLKVEGRAKSVVVDPDRLFPQDANLSNGAWTDRRDSRPAARWGVNALVWLQNALAGWGRFL